MAKLTKEQAKEKINGWRAELKEHQKGECLCENYGKCTFRQETLRFEIKRMINRFKNS
jgi:cell fate (sporulation/competence/biofilm development) regulator YmcA (YheA/YmcA/DUF963 family)